MAAVDGVIYVVGGGDGKEWLCSAEAYNTRTQKWSCISRYSYWDKLNLTACNGIQKSSSILWLSISLLFQSFVQIGFLLKLNVLINEL